MLSARQTGKQYRERRGGMQDPSSRARRIRMAASAPQRRQWKQSMLMIQGVRGTTKASAFSVEFVIYVGTQCSRLAGQIRDALQLRVWDAPALAHNKYVLHALRDQLFLFASWSSRLVCDRASRLSSRPPSSPCTYPLLLRPIDLCALSATAVHTIDITGHPETVQRVSA